MMRTTRFRRCSTAASCLEERFSSLRRSSRRGSEDVRSKLEALIQQIIERMGAGYITAPDPNPNASGGGRAAATDDRRPSPK